MEAVPLNATVEVTFMMLKIGQSVFVCFSVERLNESLTILLAPCAEEHI
jgi:hypothetical protein